MTMTRKAFLRDFWRYYIHLEKRFAGSLDYVELDECNYGTFSNYYASLLQSIGAEIDHFMKMNQLKRIANEDPNALDIPSPESDYFQLQGRDCFILSALKCVVTVDGQTYEAVAK